MPRLDFNEFLVLVPNARARKKKKSLCKVPVRLFALLQKEGGGEKSALVSHLNHTFNLTGRHKKKSAPYCTHTHKHACERSH